MIIIQMAGGLGNQMFQYALYRQLISMGKNVKMDDEAGFKEDEQRNPALAPFGIAYERASRKEIIRMTDASMFPPTRIRRKLFGRRGHSYFEENKQFQAKIFNWDNMYLEGYWQSEKYFPDVAETLKKEFSTESIGELSPQAKERLREIEQTQAVSIHVRRGDYLLPQNQALFGGICTEHYYEKAMKMIAESHPDVTFYLFTNDSEWAKGWLEKPYRTKLIEWAGAKDYELLALMSRCKHNILANSSFSWWASYLNKNPDKMVMVPDKWLNGWDCSDIYRKDMTIING